VSTFEQAQAEASPSIQPRRSLRLLYLVRGAFAVVWAVAFIVAGNQLDAVTIALLIVYPAVDVMSSGYDAVTHRATGPATMQWVNAVISTVALIGLVVASTQDNGWVLHAFGAWATISGVIQLIVAVRRRQQFGAQWAMLISGGLSTLAGIAFNVMAGADQPQLSTLGGYALLGGIFFLVNSFLLRRQERS
jgi:hypothetical protein